MTLKTQIAATTSTVFLNQGYFAELAEYTPKGAEMQEISADFRIENLLPEYEADGEFAKLVGEVLISLADIAAPAPDDKIKQVDTNITFIVKQIINQDSTMALLSIREIHRKTVATMRTNK